MTRYYIFLLVVLLASGQAYAQPTVLDNKINDGIFAGGSATQLRKAAEKATEQGDHFAAMKYYEQALLKDTTEANLLAYADAAERVFGYEQAVEAYRTVVLRGYPRSTQAEFRMAGVYYKLGRYEEAGALYDRIALGTSSPELKAAAVKGTEDAIWAIGSQKDSEYEISIEHLGESINTESSEFGPLKVGDTLYFSSLRAPFDDDKHRPERVLGKVLLNVTKAGSNYTNLSEINKPSEFTAHTAFNAAGTQMYYNICKYETGGEVVCDLYLRAKDEKGAWSEPVKLPEIINTPGKSTTQPSIGFDKLTGQEVLFYVSDKDGGKGGRDIYSINILADGSYGLPSALTAINTTQDDVTPFFHKNTGVLYFSSNGHRSLGGYDIYRTRGSGLTWSEPDHIAAPINSSSNDLYYTVTDNGYDAYFASNRPGSLYYDTVGCCYDLYRADLFKPEAIVQTYHRVTGAQLTGTRLQIIPITDTKVNPSQQDLEGFERNVEVGLAQSYRLIVDKPGFDTDTLEFTTDKNPWREPLVKKLYLQPMQVELIANSFERATKAALYGTTFEFTDLGLVTSEGTLATVKSEAERFQRENVANTVNTFARRLEFNHRYMVLVRKDGYTIDSVTVSTEGLTKSTTITRDLFLAKGGLAFEALSYDASTGYHLSGVRFRLVERPGIIQDERTIEASNQFLSGIGYSRSYCVVAEKEGFSADSTCFTTNDLSRTEMTKITKKLYLRPAGLFPLVVYFDNDEPSKRSNATVTKKTYDVTYQDYVSRRSAFEQQSPDGVVAIGDFFEREVKAGWDKLNALHSIILKELQSGNVVELEVNGYASPRAKSDYNRKLTSRRSSSIYNHFEQAQGGAFRQYMQTNKLVFVPVPQGEETAQPGISDSIPDEKNSIYTVAASRERRATIKQMRVIPRK
jgi:tetratricopeptide (TPR) repeat protein